MWVKRTDNTITIMCGSDVESTRIDEASIVRGTTKSTIAINRLHPYVALVHTIIYAFLATNTET